MRQNWTEVCSAKVAFCKPNHRWVCALISEPGIYLMLVLHFYQDIGFPVLIIKLTVQMV
jgi:hypothetical protein